MSNRTLCITLCAFVCILCIIGYGSATDEEPWQEAAFMQRGQAAIYQVQVDTSAMVKLSSVPRSNFSLHAMQVTLSGVQHCPSERELRNMALYTSRDFLILPSGQWCIEVYASEGSGRYSLEINERHSLDVSGRYSLDSTSTRDPAISTILYKTTAQTETISPRSPNVHSWLVSGERTFLEWILEPSDCKTQADIPVGMMSMEYLNELQSAACSLVLTAYLYKDCDPRSEECTPIAADESSSPYAYIGISYPQDKSKYHLLVESVEGSGTYTLTSRSYVQDHDNQIDENTSGVVSE